MLEILKSFLLHMCILILEMYLQWWWHFGGGGAFLGAHLRFSPKYNSSDEENLVLILDTPIFNFYKFCSLLIQCQENVAKKI